jgi:hypothetical protein
VLTPTEWRVLDLVREGRTNGEIAARRQHQYGADARLEFGKLAVADRRAAAAWE